MTLVRRLILVGMMLLSVLLPSTAFAAPSGGAGVAASAEATLLPPPLEIQYLCVHQGNGKVRYRATPTGCNPNNETLLTLPDNGPIYVCATRTQVRRTATAGQCSSGQTALTLPAPTTITFCAANNNGDLGYVTDPAQCKQNETPVFVQRSNQPPTAANNSYSTPEDTPLVVGPPGVLGNDSDPDNDSLTAVLGTDPVHGTLVLNANGSFTYTPSANYSGTDSFTYQARDPSGELSAVATVNLTVTPANDAPVAASQTANVDEDAAVVITLAGSDIDSAALTFSIVVGPTSGNLGPIGGATCTPSGGGTSCTANVTYTPNANFNGSDSFTFRVNDGALNSAPATVTVSIAAANDAPLTQPDSYTAIGNTPLAVGVAATGPVVAVVGSVRANDNDPEGDNITIGPATITSTNGGSVAMNADGTFSYLPAAGFVGTDTFTYTASDPQNASATGTVTIVVAGLVWYVNNTAAPGGDGRATAPFASLAALQGAGDPDGGGDIIFVYAGSGSYGGGMVLEADQQLIGQGVALTVNSVLLVPAGSAPILTNATGNGITLASDNEVRGLTIDTTAGAGIVGANASNIAIDRVTIRNTGRSGITGTQIVNFSFTNGTIVNSGTLRLPGSQDANIAFATDTASDALNVSGTVTITNSTLSNAYYHGIDIFNGAGTLANVTITGNTITSAAGAGDSLGSAIRLRGNGSDSTVANITRATIGNNTIRNFPSGAGIVIQGGNTFAADAPAASFGVAGSPTDRIAVSGNSIAGASAVARLGTNAILVAVNGKGQGNFTIANNGTVANPITNIAGNVIALSAIGPVTVTATVGDNVIVANHTAGLGGPLGISGGTGRQFAASDAPNLTITVSGNTISNVDGNGILLTARGATGTLRAKVQNNTVAAPLSGVRQGIRVDAGSATSANDTVCLNITGNTSAGSGGALGIGLRKQGTNPALHTFGINGMAATSSPGVEAYVDGLNPAGGGTLLISATSGFSTCSLP